VKISQRGGVWRGGFGLGKRTKILKGGEGEKSFMATDAKGNSYSRARKTRGFEFYLEK